MKKRSLIPLLLALAWLLPFCTKDKVMAPPAQMADKNLLVLAAPVDTGVGPGAGIACRSIAFHRDPGSWSDSAVSSIALIRDRKSVV